MRANSRHGACAGHSRQTALAWAICSIAGPVVPTGKKRSGLVSRHDARSRPSSCSIGAGSTVRESATGPPGDSVSLLCDLLHMPSHGPCGSGVAGSDVTLLDGNGKVNDL